MSADGVGPLSSGAGPFAELVVGPGFYKLGYVTTDRDEAVSRLRADLGFADWAPFAPRLEVVVESGDRGTASLRCAFARGRRVVVEVMEPVDGLVEAFSEPLRDVDGFGLVFHHIGVLVDDMDAALATSAAAGATPVWSADVPNGMRVTYLRTPWLGHLVELVYYGGDSGDFLAGVRAPVA